MTIRSGAGGVCCWMGDAGAPVLPTPERTDVLIIGPSVEVLLECTVMLLLWPVAALLLGWGQTRGRASWLATGVRRWGGGGLAIGWKSPLWGLVLSRLSRCWSLSSCSACSWQSYTYDPSALNEVVHSLCTTDVTPSVAWYRISNQIECKIH